MRYSAITFAASMLVALALPAAAQQETSGGQPVPQQGRVTLTGVVVDATNGQPLRAARLRIPAAHVDVFTNEEGRFYVEGVPAGEYGVSVSLLGYRQLAQIWTVADDEAEPQVSLQPNPILLRAINVTTGRLERRVRASGANAMAFSRDFLVASNDRDAAIFVRNMAHVQPVPCATFATAGADLNCLRVRGVATVPCVLINDTPSSWGELAMYRPRELYRVEVYKGGQAILAYTTTFAEDIALRGYNPPPIESQVQMYCRRSATLN
ncbi:MAG TPA: carboxypeptidase regulatory-like domain-containing protein [Longimicrobium sp.]